MRTVPFIMMDCAAGFGSVFVTMTLSPPNIVYIPSLSNSRGDMRVCGKLLLINVLPPIVFMMPCCVAMIGVDAVFIVWCVGVMLCV